MSYKKLSISQSRGSFVRVGSEEVDFEQVELQTHPGHEMASSESTANSSNFLEAISPPVVVTQPQSFSDAMLDPTSRSLMASLSTSHMSGTVLQGTIRQSADQLQRTIQGQFVSLKGNMSYKDLLTGLIYEGEIFQTSGNFSYMNYAHLQFLDEVAQPVNQRCGGICILTNKRILFLSSQRSTGTSLSAWGDPKTLPGGYTLKSSCNDATYYLPIPLRFLRSVEMSGASGDSCPEMQEQWYPQPIVRSQKQEMKVTIGLLMPPWERKMYACIHIDPDVPMAVTRDFVSLLQNNTPALN
ncbi:hypothetical protein P5673_019299 [Acropora cervicornis]|uniref:Uncharacterized protein n=1 Tax=Acropora cervicornis TaxID=6130 RepID=A0AAD9V1T9_ACRCE|nr:hypothetical protein P5673_019299 [Acropora cervicornis]